MLRSKWPMLVWENLLLSAFRKLRTHVLFLPVVFTRPLFTRCRTVVTTHDAVQQIYPELFPLVGPAVLQPVYTVGVQGTRHW